ncbi:hypothetical protein AM629_14260 [Photorhabdus heterorhabditis]|uniref:Uncharacterized protein n=1 Tax=Photorhabdus heterorhabditis TaxID=880156 RepID=A0ABR5K9X5_9GAMM|nr:hypothetical protein AM629_14260 [Photorhabdus heterorhabditis]
MKNEVFVCTHVYIGNTVKGKIILYPVNFKMDRDGKGATPREHIPNRFQVAVRRQENASPGA